MTPSPTDLVQAFPPQTLNFPTSALYLGDNLDFMRGMNSETVSLIATDPPFNKGVKAFKAKDGTAADGQSFTDKWNWQKDVHPQWVKDIQENWPAVGAVIEAAKLAQGYDTAAYLCWLGVRLLEMHRILRNDGAIYVHLDQTAVAWVKALMDAIFGRDNSRNEIVWRRTHSKNSVATRFGTNHDTILAYSKGKWAFNKKRAVRPFAQDEEQAGYKLDKKTGRYFALSPVHADGARNGDSGQPATFRGKVYKPPATRHWVVPGGRKSGETTSEGWARLDAEGRMHLAEGGKFPQYIRYRDEMNGVDLDDVWTDIPIPSERERTGWSTQKPIALYERIVLASSKPGDVGVRSVRGLLHDARGGGETRTPLGRLRPRPHRPEHRPAAPERQPPTRESGERASAPRSARPFGRSDGGNARPRPSAGKAEAAKDAAFRTARCSRPAGRHVLPGVRMGAASQRLSRKRP